jgi:predicted ATPase
MKFKVKTPSPFFDEVRAGIRFTNGEATFDDKKLVPIFKELGYEVIELGKEVTEEKKTDAKKAKTASKKRGE